MRLISFVALGLAAGALACSSEKKADDAKKDAPAPETDAATDGGETDGETDGGAGGEKEPPVVGNADYAGVVTLAETAVTAEAKAAASPNILFNGTDYSLLWDSDNGKHLKFQRMAVGGGLVGEAKTVYSFTNAYTVISDGRISWARADDGTYLAAFQSAGVIVGLFDEDGASVKPFAAVDANAGFPSVATDGAGFGVAYATNKAGSSPSSIVFRAVAADGTVGNAVTVSASSFAFNPKIAWNADEGLYGIVWEQQDGNRAKPYEVFFATVDASGTVVTAAKAVTSADGYDSRMSVIRAHGAGFAVLFRDSRKMKLGDHDELEKITQMRLVLLSKVGAITDVTGDGKVDADDEYLISNPYFELAKQGDLTVDETGEIGIVYDVQEAPRTVYFTQATLVSGKLTHSIRASLVPAAEDIAERPRIASHGASKYFVVWMDPRGEAAYQVYGAK